MEALLLDILETLRQTNADALEQEEREKVLAALLHKHNQGLKNNAQHHSKKRLLPFYLKTKDTDPERWATWNIDADLEKRLLRMLQMKPRRTASGVATITVISKPWKCASNCLYCPSDVRMPKSYMTSEPACQRAERNFFDPYLQVTSRLRALSHMGHPTDKIELIVLGGTWCDYPQEYQTWFVAELFRALNDGEIREETARKRRILYKSLGLASEDDELRAQTAPLQQRVNERELAYNDAWTELYERAEPWQKAAAFQQESLEELERQHALNEAAAHRVVGLVVETRPDTVSPESLTMLRRLGCTKVQMGIQSLNPQILQANHRASNIPEVRKAFALLRIFGFKIHAHFMLNLHGAAPEADKEDYREFVTDPAYLPDEVKLYPCALVDGTDLCARYQDGTWRPYTEEELLDVLAHDTLLTPPYARISRMIRDISACDILVGNKKTNLRQMVENHIQKLREAGNVSEIRFRELNAEDADVDALRFETVEYQTAVSTEYFLQWVTPQNKIAGFLRLSLPSEDFVRETAGLPIAPDEAMIREVHVYGKAAKLHASGGGAQHLGLGKRLIEEACRIAREHGYAKMNVISAIGTRAYYRNQGFADNGLYQQRGL